MYPFFFKLTLAEFSFGVFYLCRSSVFSLLSRDASQRLGTLVFNQTLSFFSFKSSHIAGVYPRVLRQTPLNPWLHFPLFQFREHPAYVVSPHGHTEVYKAGSSITSAILITIRL